MSISDYGPERECIATRRCQEQSKNAPYQPTGCFLENRGGIAGNAKQSSYYTLFASANALLLIVTPCICTAWQSGVIIVCAYAQCCSFTGLLRFTRNDNPSPSVICSLLYLGGIKTGGIVAYLFITNTRPIIAYIDYLCRNLCHVVIVPSCALYIHAYYQHKYAYHYD